MSLVESRLVIPQEIEGPTHSFSPQDLGAGRLDKGPLNFTWSNLMIVRFNNSKLDRLVHRVDSGTDREFYAQTIREGVMKTLIDDDYPQLFYPSTRVYRAWRDGEQFSNDAVEEAEGAVQEVQQIAGGYTSDCKLHHLNARLRFFKYGRGDHIETRVVSTPGDSFVGTRFLSLREDYGKAMQEMFRNGFPTLWLPFLDMDPQARSWHKQFEPTPETEAA